ncbi:7 kDa protein [Olive leaf yellowing-associated virus]|uniref:7 kDa protein n=1 Tax=Olive leaf yellowing-associated virus TaxID=82791 RepID=Q8QL59_9CLOS|nr:7 kDa protein [Olive leaf yellowing-associated virus]CAD29308.1 7 kDa protein [Olive leaf yellowing-associated virus]
MWPELRFTLCVLVSTLSFVFLACLILLIVHFSEIIKNALKRLRQQQGFGNTDSQLPFRGAAA